MKSGTQWTARAQDVTALTDNNELWMHKVLPSASVESIKSNFVSMLFGSHWFWNVACHISKRQNNRIASQSSHSNKSVNSKLSDLIPSPTCQNFVQKFNSIKSKSRFNTSNPESAYSSWIETLALDEKRNVCVTLQQFASEFKQNSF